MDESVARADRLRAMREAAAGSTTPDAAPAPAQSSLPAPFSDEATSLSQRPGFYTGAGGATQSVPSANAARAPPPPPPPPAHWVNDTAEERPKFHQGGVSGRGGGRGGGQFRGNKAARTTTSGYVKTINPAEYYKVCYHDTCRRVPRRASRIDLRSPAATRFTVKDTNQPTGALARAQSSMMADPWSAFS